MPFPPRTLTVQCCPKCNWISELEIPIRSDCVMMMTCPHCDVNLVLKSVSSLPLSTQMKVRYLITKASIKRIVCSETKSY